MRDWGRDESGTCIAIRDKVGGRGRDRTGAPLLAQHGSRLQPLYPSLLTTNVSNQSGNLLLAQGYPQWHENVAFLHSPRHSGAPAFWDCAFGNPSPFNVRTMKFVSLQRFTPTVTVGSRD